MTSRRPGSLEAKIILAVLVLVGLAGIAVHSANGTAPATVSTTTTTLGTAPVAGPSGAASAEQLAALPTAVLDPSHDYLRVRDFGPAWTDDNDDDDGHNGCDTRNDILHRDLTAIATRPGTHDCVVVAGVLADRYSGTTMTFAKANASAVQIDHVVALHAAWELGAWRWTLDQRIDYANDPTVLLAVSGSLNLAKGDRLADGWTPPDTAEWCDYAQRTVAVHVKYHLGVTAPERSALNSLLSHCA